MNAPPAGTEANIDRSEGLSRRRALQAMGAAGTGIGLLATSPHRSRAQDATPAVGGQPSDGWDLHIDAKFHFPGDGQALAHHWCKPFAGGLIECQLYDGDGPDARLVGVEVVVPAATWQGFDADEQALWHYHREEIPLVEATLPDLSAEEAAKVAESLLETYGKVYLLWDPTAQELPTGQPFVHDVHAQAMGATPTP